MANRYYQGPLSYHFDGERFFNPGQMSTDRSLAELLRWQRSGSRAAWPAMAPAIIPAVPPSQSDALRVTMIGHACVLIQLDRVNLLVDPVWSDRAGPLGRFGPTRVDPPGIRFGDLPPITAVLLTHNHYDHLDAATVRRLHARYRPRFITPLGNNVLLRTIAKDIDVVAGDWHDTFAVSNVRVTICPAYHWSARTGFDRRQALWGGFFINGTAASVYVAGDTGYGDGAIFRAVRADHGAADLAVLPIGAYEPRWFMKPQHVNPAEAVQIMQDTGARAAIGVHWGTFQLTDESRDAPPRALLAALQAAGIDAERFSASRPGQVWSLPKERELEV